MSTLSTSILSSCRSRTDFSIIIHSESRRVYQLRTDISAGHKTTIFTNHTTLEARRAQQSIHEPKRHFLVLKQLAQLPSGGHASLNIPRHLISLGTQKASLWTHHCPWTDQNLRPSAHTIALFPLLATPSDSAASLFATSTSTIIASTRVLGLEFSTSFQQDAWQCHRRQDESMPGSSARTESQYIPGQDFEGVTRALNFNTPDCSVTGDCDLYTTKSTGADKKLYRSIEKELCSQHAALLQFSASLSPPDREHMLATSPDLQLFSTASPFGPLSEMSSRRTFAYLIATLNASHPHYDFSHVLRPGDFKRERNLRRVMVNLDSILQNVRPGFDAASFDSSQGGEPGSVWGPQCWSLIDKEMGLSECTIFSWRPNPDPLEEDESAIWAAHYFFFSRALKRVAYLYVRVVPVVSSASPSSRRSWRTGQSHMSADFDDVTSARRISHGLGQYTSGGAYSFDDDESRLDDGLFWNRGEDGDLVLFSDDDYFDDDDDEMDDEDDENDEQEDGADATGNGRRMSEDIAGRMEM
ncbi:hypothetical protein E4U44_005061 [Claviceps purpurea]|nr:hypothetical protein E4U44_005061 [Claviceps purpurea]